MKAVRIHQRGGTEVLKLEEVATPVPQQGEVLIQVAVAGVNYADVGQRQGNYPNLADLPLTLGSEVSLTDFPGEGKLGLPLRRRRASCRKTRRPLHVNSKWKQCS